MARAAGGATELLAEADNVDIFATDAVGLKAHDTLGAFQYITNDPATQTMTYNGANELTSSVVGAITTTYTYDDWGRTISKTDGTHSATYYWRFGDKLKQYDTTFPGESSVAFQYDGLGKRRLKLQLPSGGYTDADFTWYRWDAGWNMIGEYAAGSNTGTEWDVGTVLLDYRVTPDGDTMGISFGGVSSILFYPAQDISGTSYILRDHAKSVALRLELHPFGQERTFVGGLIGGVYRNMFRDHENQMSYTLFRYYDSGISRWIARDHIWSPVVPNLYGFVNNNPVMLADPLGLSPTAPIDALKGLKESGKIYCKRKDCNDEISELGYTDFALKYPNSDGSNPSSAYQAMNNCLKKKGADPDGAIRNLAGANPNIGATPIVPSVRTLAKAAGKLKVGCGVDDDGGGSYFGDLILVGFVLWLLLRPRRRKSATLLLLICGSVISGCGNVAEMEQDTLAISYSLKANEAQSIDEKKVWLKKSLEMQPNWYGPRLMLAQIYAAEGSYELAREQVNEAVALIYKHPGPYGEEVAEVDKNILSTLAHDLESK